MTEIDQTIEVSIKPQSLRIIEKFVDNLCDKLLINETYYGNILMGMTETFELCLSTKKNKTLRISYTTDYQKVTIILQPIEDKILTLLKENPKLEDIGENEMLKQSFLINSLTEKIEFPDDDELRLVFDISAMLNKISKIRRKKLDDYFEQTLTKSLKKKNDKH